MTNVPEAPPAAPVPTPPPPKRDTTFGWVAHLLMLFTWFIGPLVIWLVKKDEDKYAAFHAKQSLCWVVAVSIVMLGIYSIAGLLFLIAPPLIVLGSCLVPLIGLANLAYVIVAIIYTSQGKVFKYFLVADMFCKKEFAEAYPESAAEATSAPPQ
ncbi:MAG: DUF4870 domain-containing protein [Phycisphaerae bacterium]|nr:DUF4870 domain-containing protein [Phycisphaerae bacterium]